MELVATDVEEIRYKRMALADSNLVVPISFLRTTWR